MEQEHTRSRSRRRKVARLEEGPVMGPEVSDAHPRWRGRWLRPGNARVRRARQKGSEGDHGQGKPWGGEEDSDSLHWRLLCFPEPESQAAHARGPRAYPVGGRGPG